MNYIVFLSFLTYAVLIIWLLVGFYRCLKKLKEMGDDDGPGNFNQNFSVVIAARNEAHHLPVLLDSLLKQDINWDQGEIILVLDRCTDHSEEIAWKYSEYAPYLRVIVKTDFPGENSPKKEAILAGLSLATGDIILQTDADSFLPSGWIRSHLNIYQDDQTDAAFGLFRFPSSATVLGMWQFGEKVWSFFIAVASLGWGWPFLAFGVNFSYRKNISTVHDVLEKYKKSLSGDDDLVIQNLGWGKSRIRFLWNFRQLPETNLPENFRGFLNQRKRHLAAGKHYHLSAKIFYGLFIISWTVLFVFAFIQPCFVLLLLFKFLLDYSSIYLFAKHYSPEWSWRHLVMFELFYLPYVWIVGALSRLQVPSWK